jgi:hypothetical protein
VRWHCQFCKTESRLRSARSERWPTRPNVSREGVGADHILCKHQGERSHVNIVDKFGKVNGEKGCCLVNYGRAYEGRGCSPKSHASAEITTKARPCQQDTPLPRTFFTNTSDRQTDRRFITINQYHQLTDAAPPKSRRKSSTACAWSWSVWPEVRSDASPLLLAAAAPPSETSSAPPCSRFLACDGQSP